MRLLAWIGIAAMAAAWLPGWGLYHLPDMTLFLWLALGGAVLLLPEGFRLARAGSPWAPAQARQPAAGSPAARVLAGAALLAGAFVAPWPEALPLLLIAGGLLLGLLPLGRISAGPAWALLGSGLVLLVQALLMLGYTELTARVDDLPQWSAALTAWVGRLLDLRLQAGPGKLVLHSMRQNHDFWNAPELLLDPVTLCFLAGGLAWVLTQAWSARPGACVKASWRALAGLVVGVTLYLPLRVGILLAIYMHRVLRTDYDAPMQAMTQFWSTALLLALQAVPVLLAWRLARVAEPPPAGAPPEDGPRRPARSGSPAAPAGARLPRRALACALVLMASGALTAAILLNVVGDRKGGRVVIDEHTTDWEPTQRPFDTEYYGHMSGYNYACIYDYCSRFYSMSRLEAQATPGRLADKDVLVIKTPLLAYSQEEIQTIVEFVRRGGGLLLVGEHTDVFGSGRSINAVARRFGFEFRYDCLFGVDSFFDDLYTPARVAHPVVRHMPPMDFATSCSIDPGWSAGRSVITGVGLKNLLADYHAPNLYPQAENRPDMRYGSFVQLWSARLGRGRVLAFTDSTIFSNFSTFEPGKAELFLGMIEWLNHRDDAGELRLWLLGLAGLLAIAALLAGWGWSAAWLGFLASAAAGWAASASAIDAYHRSAMPPPAPQRPLQRVVFDRTVCDGTLSKGGFIGGKQDGFGIFERWCLRVGAFNIRASGEGAFQGNLLILTHPHLQTSQKHPQGTPESRRRATEFAAGLRRYVEGGGKVLVLDSPRNPNSLTNDLLAFAGLKVGPGVPGGPLQSYGAWPEVDVESALEVSGGKRLAGVNGKTVAAMTLAGKGSVTLLGFGSRFNDDQYGVTGDVEPKPALRAVFDLQFKLLRDLLDLKAPPAATQPAAAPAETQPDEPDPEPADTPEDNPADPPEPEPAMEEPTP